MANDNNIKHFTAADIERYHKGMLSNKERHDLEKAAMNDPFLADALEGYAVAGVNAGNDIAELKKKLSDKVEKAKVISIRVAPRNSFRALRAAILVAFVAGASYLIYQFGFNKKEGEIAQAETAKKETTGLADTTKVVINNPTTSAPVSEIRADNGNTVTALTQNTATVTDKETKPGGSTNNNVINGETTGAIGKKNDEDLTISRSKDIPSATTNPVKGADEKNNWYKTADKDAEKKEVAHEDAAEKNKVKVSNKQEADDALAKKQAEQQQNNRSVAAARKATDNNYYRDQQASNVFRGRVIDADNNGVPFANVTNVQDNNAGTYTDARGYFNLTYPDSVMSVQVRSVGFENTNVQLRNTASNNQVVMQEDRKSLSEVVLTNQKPNAAARNNRDVNLKLEEPEPADGWENYDAYLVNNLEVPEDLKNRQNGSGEVQVSFEVDKNGEPINIKVEKSLCTKCDKEAIRLIKEGPKWKRKAKKGRTTVSIYF
ncbi:MAG: carboxypeptidase-like regulatory domain-containing protein [Chitinophagaceae bacterium]